MAAGIPSIHVTVGGRDYTAQAQNLTWSNVDPGGYEMASFDLQVDQALYIKPGDRVVIKDGIKTIWEGRVAEPAKQLHRSWMRANRKAGATTTRVSCEGFGAAFKDNFYSYIYIDRNITQWQSFPLRRQAGLATSSWNTSQFSWQIGADAVAGDVGFVIQADGPLVGKPVVEIWYDAGPGNLISRMRGTIITQTLAVNDPQNVVSAWATVDTTAATNYAFLNLAGPGSSPRSFDSAVALPQRYAFFQMIYNTSLSSGSAGIVYGWNIYNISLMGPHGLTLYGTAPASDGLYANQIATHAVQQAQQNAKMRVKLGRIDQIDSFVILHYVQYTPVDYETVIADMAKLAPAHYGTWESSSMFDDTPEFTFRAYDTSPTAYTSLAELDEADVSERISNMYTSVLIIYQDASGMSYELNYSLPNTVLQQAGIQRTSQLDIGISTSAAAQIFAAYALQALYAQSRTAGTVQTTQPVRDRNGAYRPAYHLKSGIDRLRIEDLPNRNSLISITDDSLRISRVESNINNTSGQVQTRIELDAGPNLLDTLQARVQIADQLVGF